MRHFQDNKSNTIKSTQQITLGPNIPVVAVPIDITVHLGAPDEDAENITLPFIEYIKNVASSELYPTWPENALIANITAITSFTMNRMYTEWYRSRGYNFDITSSTQYDQAFVPNRGIFDNIANLVEAHRGNYIVREGQIQPYFAQFCDGRITTCDGLSQWGSVDLANQGFSPLEILRYYYGDDINIVKDAPFAIIQETYPGEPLQYGDADLNVLKMQYYLNRIATNYPGIPRIEIVEGYFGDMTLAAVKAFQSIFNLPVTGIIDEGTWYMIRRIFSAVTRLSELSGEGLLLIDMERITSGVLLEGDIRPSVEIVQFALNILSVYYPTIPQVPITGIFDDSTRIAITEFQKTMGLPVRGVADMETLQAMYAAVRGILDTLPAELVFIPYLRWPGVVYDLGHESPGVYIIQEMLSYISLIVPIIPYMEPTGVYDEKTKEAVTIFQGMEGLEQTGIVDEQTWNSLVDVYRRQRYSGTSMNFPI